VRKPGRTGLRERPGNLPNETIEIEAATGGKMVLGPSRALELEAQAMADVLQVARAKRVL